MWLTCDRERSVDCQLEMRRWLNPAVIEDQKNYDFQSVSIGSHVLELVTMEETIKTDL